MVRSYLLRSSKCRSDIKMSKPLTFDLIRRGKVISWRLDLCFVWLSPVVDLYILLSWQVSSQIKVLRVHRRVKIIRTHDFLNTKRCLKKLFFPSFYSQKMLFTYFWLKKLPKSLQTANRKIHVYRLVFFIYYSSKFFCFLITFIFVYR